MAAPDLFNCIIDYLMENVSSMVPGIQLGQYHLTDLEYTDDAAIFATNQNDISSALAIITNTGDLQPDINRRIGLATGVMRSLRQPLMAPLLHQPRNQAARVSVIGTLCPPIRL